MTMRSCWISSRRLGIALCLVGFLWGLALINFSMDAFQHASTSAPPRPDELRAEIISLSEAYVATLARDQRWLVDGPRSGADTGYDLKRPMAVVLQNILHRLEIIESYIALHQTNDSVFPPPVQQQQKNNISSFLHNQRKFYNNSRQTLIDLITSKVSCDLTAAEKKSWPECVGKMNWMDKMWRQDDCYKDYGVDGTRCAFRIYLSYVESWCPEMEGLVMDPIETSAGPTVKIRLEAGNLRPVSIGPLPILHRQQVKAQLNLDLQQLIALFKENDKKHYDWIKLRLRQTWPSWEFAAESLATNSSFMDERHRKTIVVFMGLLTQKGWNFGEGAFKGGPLGELVQWSDLIAALHVLGHSVNITSNVDEFVKILRKDPHSKRQGCPAKLPSNIDLIFTDISGLRLIKQHLKAHKRYTCRLRVLDSFGTEAPFNSRSWVVKSKLNKKNYDTQWGKHDLNLKQFYTMFPHTPDNTFLGFVVEEVNSSRAIQLEGELRQNISLVYGKDVNMWKGKEELLRVIRDAGLEVHGTVFVDKKKSTSKLPDFVVNHGLLSGDNFQRLLRRTKLFVGLGFPYEGPAVLEAIANGAVFLNPKFVPPHGRANTAFFKGKPTSRNLTSQHPYAEEFVRAPGVITVDVDDLKAVEKAVKGVVKSEVTAHLPYEYTTLGTLQRTALLLENQDFCDSAFDFVDASGGGGGGVGGGAPTVRGKRLARLPWPPKSAFTFGFAAPGQNCKDFCHSSGLICDSAFVPLVNSQASLISFGLTCSSLKIDDAFHLPAFNAAASECLLQRNPLLHFSCTATPPDHAQQRVCPCRDYLEEQTAICKDCLVAQPWGYRPS